MDSRINIEEIFKNHYYYLDSETIHKMNDWENMLTLNNVIIGMNEHCYGAMLKNEENFEFQLFYVSGKDELEGGLIELSLETKYKDELVFHFSDYLSYHYGVDTIDAFNTFQFQARSLFEKLGYITISTAEIKNKLKKHGYNSVVSLNAIAFTTIQKFAFYKFFFGNKVIEDTNDACGYVYLMLNTRNGYIKIGKSKTPRFREKTLQSDEPEIELITFWKAPSCIKKELHTTFKNKRIRGEWFDLSFQDLKKVESIMSEYSK